jgi:hypothetical protein
MMNEPAKNSQGCVEFDSRVVRYAAVNRCVELGDKMVISCQLTKLAVAGL